MDRARYKESDALRFLLPSLFFFPCGDTIVGSLSPAPPSTHLTQVNISSSVSLVSTHTGCSDNDCPRLTTCSNLSPLILQDPSSLCDLYHHPSRHWHFLSRSLFSLHSHSLSRTLFSLHSHPHPFKTLPSISSLLSFHPLGIRDKVLPYKQP